MLVMVMCKLDLVQFVFGEWSNLIDCWRGTLTVDPFIREPSLKQNKMLKGFTNRKMEKTQVNLTCSQRFIDFVQKFHVWVLF